MTEVKQANAIEVHVSIAANKPWQGTGVFVNGWEKVSIRYISGQWSDNPSTGNTDANGNPKFKAKDGYTFPGANEGAMIGRIGSTKFLVGDFAEIPMSLSGQIELCINDDLDGRYGSGLKDNTGDLMMEIMQIL